MGFSGSQRHCIEGDVTELELPVRTGGAYHVLPGLRALRVDVPRLKSRLHSTAPPNKTPRSSVWGRAGRPSRRRRRTNAPPRRTGVPAAVEQCENRVFCFNQIIRTALKIELT